MGVLILATDKSQRRCGRGSALVGILTGFSRLLGLSLLAVSATDESRAFWIKQGCHLAPFCTPRLRSALRALTRTGNISALANPALMAASIAYDDGHAAGGGAGGGPSADSERGGGNGGDGPSAASFPELLDVIARFGVEREAGLSPRAAAMMLAFGDVRERGNFWLLPDGTREHVQYEPSQVLDCTGRTCDPASAFFPLTCSKLCARSCAHQHLPALFEWVPYKRLEAFYAGANRCQTGQGPEPEGLSVPTRTSSPRALSFPACSEGPRFARVCCVGAWGCAALGPSSRASSLWKWLVAASTRRNTRRSRTKAMRLDSQTTWSRPRRAWAILCGTSVQKMLAA